MAWGRGSHARGEDAWHAGLSIESIEFFDDEDPENEPDAAARTAHTEQTDPADTQPGTAAVPHSQSGRSVPDTPPVELVVGRPASPWSRIPLRYRVTAIAAALVLVVGSVATVQLSQTARRQAAERFTLAVVDNHYQPTISQVGLNLGLTLINHGPAPVTVVFLQVSQPGLNLNFYPVRVPLPVGKPTALTLVGVFDCEGATATRASTVEVTVNGQTGISSVTLKLKSDSIPPTGWQDQRSEFCSTSSTGSGH